MQITKVAIVEYTHVVYSYIRTVINKKVRIPRSWLSKWTIIESPRQLNFGFRFLRFWGLHLNSYRY